MAASCTQASGPLTRMSGSHSLEVRNNQSSSAKAFYVHTTESTASRWSARERVAADRLECSHREIDNRMCNRRGGVGAGRLLFASSFGRPVAGIGDSADQSNRQ